MDAPKSVSRPKRWSAEVEEAYRFQLAGYKGENEYINIQSVGEVSYNMCSNPTSYLYVHGMSILLPSPLNTVQVYFISQKHEAWVSCGTKSAILKF